MIEKERKKLKKKTNNNLNFKGPLLLHLPFD